MAIQAVIFDLGETLLSYGDVDVNDMFRQGARLTYDFLRGIAGEGTGLPSFERYYRRHIFTIRLRYLWSNLVDREFECLSLLHRKAKMMGILLTPAQLQELAWLWYQPLGQSASWEADIAQTLQRLGDMRLKLGILSNTFLPGAVLDRQLEQIGILKFFPVRIYSCDTVFRKPSGRIYQTALQRLAVPAHAAVMVGDKLREDIRGSRKSGLRAVWKRTRQNQHRIGAPDVPQIHAISELPDLIQTWNADSAAGD